MKQQLKGLYCLNFFFFFLQETNVIMSKILFSTVLRTSYTFKINDRLQVGGGPSPFEKHS